MRSFTQAFQLCGKDGGCTPGRASLVVIIDKIGLVYSTVGSTTIPIVHYVIENIHAPGIIARAVQASAQTPVAAVVVGQQVVVNSADVAADGAGKTVGFAFGVIFMACHVQGFGYHAALQGDILGIARAEHFVYGPAYGAMIYNAEVAPGHTHAVGRFTSSQSDTNKTGNSFVTGADGGPAQANAFTRSGLSGQGKIVVHKDAAAQFYSA